MNHLYKLAHGNSQGYPQVITKTHFFLKQMPRQKFPPRHIFKALVRNCSINHHHLTIPETNIAHENPRLWEIPSTWWIFHGYVSFLEGNNPPIFFGDFLREKKPLMGVLGVGVRGPATVLLCQAACLGRCSMLWPVVGKLYFPPKNGGDFSRPRCKKCMVYIVLPNMNGDFVW